MSVELLPDGRVKIQVSVRIPGKDHPVSRRELFKGSLKAAKNREYEIKRELRENYCAAPRKEQIPTFSDVLDLYTNSRDVDIGTVSHFKILKQELGRFEIDMELMLRFIQYVGRLKTEGKASGTINRRIAWAKAALNFAASVGYVQSNPLANLKRMKETPRNINLSEDDEARIVEACRSEAPFLLPLVMFALSVPIRIDEARRLDIADVDLGCGLIRIRNGISKGGWGGWKPIPPHMFEYFRQHPEGVEPAFYKKIVNERFKTVRYERLGRIDKQWKKIATKSKLSDLRFHDLRHAAVSKLTDAGNGDQAVMQAAGWKTNMLKVYYHWDGRKVAQQIRFPEADSRDYKIATFLGANCG